VFSKEKTTTFEIMIVNLVLIDKSLNHGMGVFKSLVGRFGICISSPPQFGQILLTFCSMQFTQKVHSILHIRASSEAGGKSIFQHSQFGFNLGITIL